MYRLEARPMYKPVEGQLPLGKRTFFVAFSSLLLDLQLAACA